MVEREYKRTDKGRFASAEEMEEDRIAKLDSAMNSWIVTQTRGPNSRNVQMARKLFGKPKTGGK
jgi:hypothetical protein